MPTLHCEIWGKTQVPCSRPDCAVCSADKAVKRETAVAEELSRGFASARAFLSSMARGEAEHDVETCGTCAERSIWAQVAQELLEARAEGEEAVTRWSEETARRWRDSKFKKLWREEEAAGRDPRETFKERGWCL
jgi:hypothetical protein